jgi:hypothetical protein
MIVGNLLLTIAVTLALQSSAPVCSPSAGRQAAFVRGKAIKGQRVTIGMRGLWILTLDPGDHGWFLSVTMKGREGEDLARLTPPWHFVPNAREIEGWHFRNIDNTGPNDGSVNAPQRLREFIFSPDVGRTIEYSGSATAPEDVEKVRAFGRGWLFIESYRLTPTRPGDRAAIESLTFSACLTWPRVGP